MGPPPVPHFPTSPGLTVGDNTGVGVGPGMDILYILHFSTLLLGSALC